MQPLSLKQVIHGFNRREADAVRWVYDTYYPGIASFVESISGITPDTAKHVIKAGADVLVAGSAVFSPGPGAYARAIASLRG